MMGWVRGREGSNVQRLITRRFLYIRLKARFNHHLLHTVYRDPKRYPLGTILLYIH
jgi:hypothetical protein